MAIEDEDAKLPNDQADQSSLDSDDGDEDETSDAKDTCCETQV